MSELFRLRFCTMIPRDFLTDVAERLALGMLRTEHLPGAAIEALERGLDGHYLRMLAGWTEARSSDRRDLFAACLREQDLLPVSEEQALRQRVIPLLGAFLAHQIDITVMPEALIARCGRIEILYREPLFVLWCYVTDWNDYDQDEWHVMFERSARDEAKRLLALWTKAP